MTPTHARRAISRAPLPRWRSLALVVLLAGVVPSPVAATAAEPTAETPAETAERRARTWHVGPGRTLATPSAAAAVARDGDTVEIDAGRYAGDVATWTQDDLTLRGLGAGAHLAADGQSAQGKAIWVIAGDRTRVENVEFSGAAVRDGNGAGIRQEGAGLVVVRCSFHDNENGILAGANPDSDIEVRRSRFFRNGAGDGQTHNIYIGTVRSFYLKGSYVWGASIGHEVKSRALRTTITANRILDRSATASYSIDLPDGGDAKIAGNLIAQGPRSENSTVVSYGAESLANPTMRLWVLNNTLVNQQDGGTFVAVAPGAGNAHVWNNLLVGPGRLVSGPAERRANLRVGTGGFVAPDTWDYRLRASSRAIDAGAAAPRRQRPRYEYRHPTRYAARPTVARIDLGAFEYVPG